MCAVTEVHINAVTDNLLSCDKPHVVIFSLELQLAFLVRCLVRVETVPVGQL